MTFHLEIRVDHEVEFEDDCDGCGKSIELSQPYLTEITSCCGGGCTRSLCFDCVKEAMKLVEEHNAV